MDQVSLVVSALAAGAKAGTADTADPAVKDAYDRLKLLIFPLVLTFAEYEKDPDAWHPALTRSLADSDATDSPQLIRTAHELLALLERS